MMVVLLGLSPVGVLFVRYLTSLELLVIHAICRWCVTAAVLVALIWMMSVVAYRRSRIEGRPSATLERTPTLDGRS